MLEGGANMYNYRLLKCLTAGLLFVSTGQLAAAGEEKKAGRAFRLVREFTDQNREKLWRPAISPDGKRIATAEKFKKDRRWAVSVYEVASGKKLFSPPVVGSLRSFRFSSDGTVLAIPHFSKAGISVLELRPGGRTMNIKVAAYARTVAFYPDGRFLAYDDRRDIEVLNLRTGKVALTLKGHKKSVGALAWSGDGKYILSGTRVKGALRLWDVRKGTTVREVKLSDRGYWSVMISPDGRRAAVEEFHALARLVNLQTGKEIGLKFKRDWKSGERAIMSPDGKQLVVRRDKAVFIFRTADGGLLGRAQLPRGYHDFAFMRVSKDGGQLFGLESGTKTFKLWALEMPQDAEGLKKRIAELGAKAKKEKALGHASEAKKLLEEAARFKKKLEKTKPPAKPAAGAGDKEPK